MSFFLSRPIRSGVACLSSFRPQVLAHFLVCLRSSFLRCFCQLLRLESRFSERYIARTPVSYSARTHSSSSSCFSFAHPLVSPTLPHTASTTSLTPHTPIPFSLSKFYPMFPKPDGLSARRSPGCLRMCTARPPRVAVRVLRPVRPHAFCIFFPQLGLMGHPRFYRAPIVLTFSLPGASRSFYVAISDPLRPPLLPLANSVRHSGCKPATPPKYPQVPPTGRPALHYPRTPQRFSDSTPSEFC